VFRSYYNEVFVIFELIKSIDLEFNAIDTKNPVNKKIGIT